MTSEQKKLIDEMIMELAKEDDKSIVLDDAWRFLYDRIVAPDTQSSYRMAKSSLRRLVSSGDLSCKR